MDTNVLLFNVMYESLISYLVQLEFEMDNFECYDRCLADYEAMDEAFSYAAVRVSRTQFPN